MKRIWHIVFFTFFISGVWGQETDSAWQSPGINPDFAADVLAPRKLQVHVEFGSYFTTSSGAGSGFGTFVAPRIGYQLSPKFRLSTGIQVMQTTGYSGLDGRALYKPMPLLGDAFGTMVFVRGDYRLTEQIVLSGTAYKQVDLFRLNQPNQPPQSYDYQGIIMGIDYQMGRHFFIRGEVEFSNGHNQYRSLSPFMNSRPGHFFNNDSFNR